MAVGDGPLTARTRPDPSEAVGQVAFGYFDRERGYLAASVTAMTLGVARRRPSVAWCSIRRARGRRSGC